MTTYHRLILFAAALLLCPYYAAAADSTMPDKALEQAIEAERTTFFATLERGLTDLERSERQRRYRQAKTAVDRLVQPPAPKSTVATTQPDTIETAAARLQALLTQARTQVTRDQRIRLINEIAAAEAHLAKLRTAAPLDQPAAQPKSSRGNAIAGFFAAIGRFAVAPVKILIPSRPNAAARTMFAALKSRRDVTRQEMKLAEKRFAAEQKRTRATATQLDTADEKVRRITREHGESNASLNAAVRLAEQARSSRERSHAVNVLIQRRQHTSELAGLLLNAERAQTVASATYEESLRRLETAQWAADRARQSYVAASGAYKKAKKA
jgi:hypothetical protein